MADEPPGPAAVQPTLPRRRNRRRQQNHSNWRRRFSGPHVSGSASADPARYGRSLRDRLTALSAADVDGWAVTPEDRDRPLGNSRWTSDRCVFEQLHPAQ